MSDDLWASAQEISQRAEALAARAEVGRKLGHALYFELTLRERKALGLTPAFTGKQRPPWLRLVKGDSSP